MADETATSTNLNVDVVNGAGEVVDTVELPAAIFGVLMLAVGGPMALFLRHVPVRQTPGLLMVLDLILLAVFSLMLSQTLASAVIGFYERGDLDLLLSSPLPPRRALTVRHLVEQTCREILDRAARAAGPGPLAFDAAHAQRVADLTVYLRQHHGERDLEAMARRPLPPT